MALLPPVAVDAPFDGTTSYRPGTRFGSSAIRHESYGIESYSPYQDLDLDGDVTDIGDIELPFGSSGGGTGCDHRSDQTHPALPQTPVHAGRRTPIDLGAFRAVLKPRTSTHHPLCAHADLRDDYLGVAFPCLRPQTLLGTDRKRKDLPVWHPFGR